MFGISTVPDGTCGPWTISTFVLTKEDVEFANLRAAFSGSGYAVCAPGTYRKLSHAKRGCVMSNTPMEVRTAHEAYWNAKGRVLIAGLGLGMVLEGLLSKPDVTFVRVIEIDADVIALVGPHFANDPRVEIIHADITTYKPAKGERFDYAWHDIWDDICSDNLPQMATLSRRFCRIASKQGFWSREQARMAKRRYG